MVNHLQFLDYSCHLCVVGHLAFLIPALVDSIDPQTSDMATEDPGDEHASTDLLFEHPLDFEHAPISLNGNGCEPFLLPVSFRFSAKLQTVKINQ